MKIIQFFSQFAEFNISTDRSIEEIAVSLHDQFVSILNSTLSSFKPLETFKVLLSNTTEQYFCHLIIKEVLNTTGPTSNVIRASELGGCLIAITGGVPLVSTLLYSAAFCLAQINTVAKGQAFAYLIATALVYSRYHTIDVTKPGYMLGNPTVVAKARSAIENFFTTIIQLLARLVQKPQPVLTFCLTFIALIFRIPAFTRFIPVELHMQLPNYLKALNANELVSTVFDLSQLEGRKLCLAYHNQIYIEKVDLFHTYMKLPMQIQ